MPNLTTNEADILADAIAKANATEERRTIAARTKATIKIETERIKAQALIDAKKQEAINRRWLISFSVMASVVFLCACIPLSLMVMRVDPVWAFPGCITGALVMIGGLLSGNLQLWGKQK